MPRQESVEKVSATEHLDLPFANDADNNSDLKKLEGGIHLQSEEYQARERKLVRKLDMTLVPMVWLLYLFNYLDRNNISQAKLSTFEKDLGLQDSDYNVAVSILNVGYMLMQLPSNMILTRTRPSLYLPICAALWSCVSAATAACKNFPQLVALRFFLGIVEAPFFPGAMYLLSCYYTKKELAKRTAIFYSGVILATAFSGLISAGVFAGLSGKNGLSGWKWLFLSEGAGSFFLALVAMFILPDFPDQKPGRGKWPFTAEELALAHERIVQDRVSIPQAKASVWTGLLLAVKDIRTWIFTLMLTANHSAYGFNNFFPTIVKGMNFGNNTITLILTAPPYLLATGVAFFTAWSSDRRNERGWHISVPMAVACVGFIISVATLNSAARYAAAFLYISGCFSSNALVFSWAASVLNQTPEKRACATAIINLLSQLGNIWSPYFFPNTDGPRYIMAFILMMAFAVLSIVTAVVTKLLLMRANKQLKATGQDLTLYTL